MIISAIIAMGHYREIGRDGGLPWPRLAEDMKWFREHTMGKAVIVGRRTWDGLKTKPLPGRRNIILSYCMAGEMLDPWCYDANSPDKALEIAERHNSTEAVVIGGAETYRAFEDRIERWYVTSIGAVFPEADTHFEVPHAWAWDWDVTSVRESGAGGPYPLKFLELRRRRS